MARIDLKPLPFREAIEYFNSKGYAPQMQRFSYLDHWREEHARNFVVAKAMRDDVLQAIRGELAKALQEGRTLQQFQSDLKPTLQKLGWWGRSIERDPLTGEMAEVQLGSMRRLRTIFDTNMRTANAAGHWARIQRTKKGFPYLRYIQIERPSKRHDHARFHDKIWRVDDPIWLTIYPPNGYFCGCTVVQMTEGQLRREGRTVSPPLDLDAGPWTNKRTGEVFEVPAGITPGFDANPGAAWLDLGDAWERMTPDLTSERRAYERGVIEGLRLRRTGDPRETLTVLNGGSEPVALKWSEMSSPGKIVLDGLPVVPGATYLHSHITEAGLSSSDLVTLARNAGHSISAISPGGSMWRAVRVPDVDLRPLIGDFSDVLGEFRADLEPLGPRGAEIYFHALSLWLEKKGAITYSWHMSERSRQFIDGHADLLQRLLDARP